MEEFLLLQCFLFVGFILAPIATNQFLLQNNRSYSDAHKISICFLFIGHYFSVQYLALVWPLFCGYGFYLYCRTPVLNKFSAEWLVLALPFLFSFLSASWYVADALGLKLLGYDQRWSYYASLHSIYLGWIFLICIGYLSNFKSKFLYQFYSLFAILCFLLVALGMEGIPLMKPIAVFGLTLSLPLLFLLISIQLKGRGRKSLLFSSISFVAICTSMALVISHEFFPGFPNIAFGISLMGLTLGLLNALIAITCLYLSIHFVNLTSPSTKQQTANIVLFDDICILCSTTVQLLLKLDKDKVLRYASLDGKLGLSLQKLGQIVGKESVVFASNGKYYTKAQAVIQILYSLQGIYRIISIILSIFPFFIMDFVYSLIAKYRYRLFGKRESCFLPGENVKELFLD
ncbi:thiol-disulfide oxidoreductase DCC family protein [Leptospira ryugenii]|uniref:thiol-disulfide oxidoreductase DCC family protein n=1 Tax=Leptospira ryugenii TaxID=1917863 RepID=UPI0014354459|nr:DCC1-like thiol-disulfide oxidoreductase family protein [Leptospira ryugenii]